MPTPQGGLWVQHFRTEQDETGKSSSRQTFPTNNFCAGHGVFGRKGLDKGPSCYAKCWVLAQLLAPVPLTLLSHCPAKATHATVKKHKKKTLGHSQKENHRDGCPSLESCVTALPSALSTSAPKPPSSLVCLNHILGILGSKLSDSGFQRQ